MARPIAYDPDKLKLDIMTLFWEKGYSDTSLVGLEEATGLIRRQLCHGIGDKLGMFVKAIDAFTELSAQSFPAPLETDNASFEDLAKLFAQINEGSKEPLAQGLSRLQFVPR